MRSILKRLRQLDNDELLSVSEAIDGELERRLEIVEQVPESARRRAIQRSQSYRRGTGSSAPPIGVTGLKTHRRRPRAA
jgi:hypothetical protein